MDSGRDGRLWQFKWHILIVCATLVGVVLLALFTSIFEKSDNVRHLVWLLGALVFLGALMTMLDRVSKIAQAMRESNSQLEEATKALENIRAGLAQINHTTRVSDAAKAIAFRDADHQSLREVVFEKLKQQAFGEAYRTIDEIGERPEYAELAKELREQATGYRNATEHERIEQSITFIENLLNGCRWGKASVQIEALIREHPESERALSMRQLLVERKEERKRILLAAWDDAIQRQETDRSLAILKDLDMYLTPNEGLALQEAAKDVFRTKLHNLGVQFSLAVSDKQWGNALEIGQQIIADFPNSRMASEIRSKLDVLQQNVQMQHS